MNCEDIREKLSSNRIPFMDSLPEKLQIYLELLKEWNSRMDLTSVTDDDETLDKHFIDSLTVLKTGLIPDKADMIDVGTGAGFPGMILAIARPDCHVTLMDSQKKRLFFLEEVARKADVSNIALLHARAEDAARKPEMREKFSCAVARAVAPLNVLCEYLLPYVRIGGYALCWKGPALKNETESGRKAASLLGGITEEPVLCPVYGKDWEHMILPVRKTDKTPAEYPRKAGIPKTRPLGL